jgi:hypothetical protein
MYKCMLIHLSISTRYRPNIVDIDNSDTEVHAQVLSISIQYCHNIVDIDDIIDTVRTCRSLWEVNFRNQHDIVTVLSILTSHIHVDVYGKSIVDIDTISSHHCRYRRYRHSFYI